MVWRTIRNRDEAGAAGTLSNFNSLLKSSPRRWLPRRIKLLVILSKFKKGGRVGRYLSQAWARATQPATTPGHGPAVGSRSDHSHSTLKSDRKTQRGLHNRTLPRANCYLPKEQGCRTACENPCDKSCFKAAQLPSQLEAEPTDLPYILRAGRA